jgi:hypothetical protein
MPRKGGMQNQAAPATTNIQQMIASAEPRLSADEFQFVLCA